MMTFSGIDELAIEYEKEVKRLNSYIVLLLEEKRRAQAAYFVMGVATGSLLSAMFVMWVLP